MSLQNNATNVAKAIMAGKTSIQTTWGNKSLEGLTSMIKQAQDVTLLERVEAFLSGFEDDNDQPDVTQLLEDLRTSISDFKG